MLVTAVMSIYMKEQKKVRVGIELSEEFCVKVDVHQRSTLSPLLFAIVADEFKERARES